MPGEFAANPAIEWHRDSGGHAAKLAIIARLQVLQTDPSQKKEPDVHDMATYRQYFIDDAGMVDIPLYEALEPERQRQRNGMIAAMTRTVKLVHPDFA